MEDTTRYVLAWIILILLFFSWSFVINLFLIDQSDTIRFLVNFIMGISVGINAQRFINWFVGEKI